MEFIMTENKDNSLGIPAVGVFGGALYLQRRLQTEENTRTYPALLPVYTPISGPARPSPWRHPTPPTLRYGHGGLRARRDRGDHAGQHLPLRGVPAGVQRLANRQLFHPLIEGHAAPEGLRATPPG